MHLKIVFMGTPQFAVPSLQAIKDAGHHIVAVITSPDKRGGRGRKQIIQSDVKKHVLDWNIPILQPRNLKDPEFQQELAALKADIQVVVAFRMLPESVWDMPPLGTINLHASLLPDYRGAAPINWAIINGETETGLTTFQLQHAIDTGDLLLQKKIPILPEDNAGTLHDRLMMAGPDLLVKTLDMIASGKIESAKQDEPGDEKKAPKLNLENTRIDFNQPTAKVYNFIRGLSPYPVAWTELNGLKFKIYEAKISESPDNIIGSTTGTVLIDKDSMYVRCEDKSLEIITVQLEGKRQMSIRDFINGYQEEISSLG